MTVIIESQEEFHLLDDEPSDQDSFGAHRRIASAIKNLVSTNQGGKTIALMGEWGSGKSTTIKQLKLLLTSNINVFTYDAWVHSGDHLRKSFLNELIDFLIDSKRLQDVGYWEEQKKILAGKLKKVDKTTEPELTAHGRVLIPLFLALPVTTVLFNNLIQGYIKDQYFFTPYHWLVLAITILCFITILWPFIYITKQICFGEGDKVLSLVMNKAVFHETTTSTEQPEATSIEFQEVFRRLMRTALIDDQNKNNKLVIVIDNLDRVDTEEAKNIWSFLKGFIDNSSYKKQEERDWLEKLWVIVPLAIKDMASDQSKITDSKNLKADEHFLEKIFQVRFFLPPPVHSEWKKHLIELLTTTFPSKDAVQLRLVQRLYENFIFEVPPLTNATRNPNPRELKLFINDLVAMVVQWGDCFTLGIYASYLLAYRSAKNEFLTKLRSGSAVTQSVKRILNEDPNKKYAALFFNIDDLESANAVLLKPMVEDILRRDSGTKLLQELQNNKNLIDMLGIVIHSTLPAWVAEQPENFFRSIMIIANALSNDAAISDGVFSNEIKEELCNLTSNALRNDYLAFPLLIRNSADAVIEVSNVSNGDQIADSIVFALKKLDGLKNDSYMSIYPVHGMPIEEMAWIDEVKKLCSTTKIKQILNKQSHGSIKLPIGMNGWLSLCENEIEGNGDFLRVIHPSYDEATRRQEFEFQIADGAYEPRYASLIKREILYSTDHGLLDSVIHSMQKYASNKMPIEATLNILMDLVKLRHLYKKVDATLAELSNDGTLSHLFQETAVNNNNKKLAAITMLGTLISNPQLTPHEGATAEAIAGMSSMQAVLKDISSHSEIFSELIEFIESYGEHRVLIDVVMKNNSAASLTKYLESNGHDKKKIYQSFDAKNIFAEIKKYSRYMNHDEKTKFYTAVFKEFVGNRSFTVYLHKYELSKSDIMIYSLLLEESSFRTIRFVKNIIKLLNSVTAADWHQNLLKYTWPVKLVCDLVNGNHKLELGETVKDGMYELLKTSLVEDTSKITNQERFLSRVHKAMSEETQTNFVLDLYELVAQPDKALNLKFWELFRRQLQAGILLLGKKSMLLRRFVKPLIINKDEEGIKWLNGFLESRSFSDFDDDKNSKRDIVNLINQLSKNNEIEPAFRDQLNQFLKLLNRRKKREIKK
jgi:energy-coupling factor transporter ATP-binding protein EcfA2